MVVAGTPAPAQNIDQETLQRLREAQQSGQLTQEQQSQLDRLREQQQQQLQQRQLDRQQRQGAEEQAQPAEEDLSPLERDYTSRIGGVEPRSRAGAARPESGEEREPLRQYGYDIFDSIPAPGELTTGRVPDDYVLGIGDELVFNFVGSTQRSVVAEVDSEGRVVLPDLTPIPAAGRTFGEFQEAVKARTKAALLGTEVFVSVGAVRMVSVYVLGEVENPGIQRVTSLSTPLEALALAGGIKKTGSLRGIRIRRGNEVHALDLYDVLNGRPGMDRNLRDGDQIIVPTIGATVAVTGEVNREGIYELGSDRGAITVAQAVAHAGGTLRPRGYAYSINHVGESGRQTIRQAEDKKTKVEEGDILRVRLRENVQVGEVQLRGHVRVPGARPLDNARMVSSLIQHVDQLQEDPYLPFAVVETTDPETQARVLEGINLQKILRGEADYKLKDKDAVYVFGLKDIEFLSSALLRQVVATGEMPTVASAASQTEQAGEVQEGLLTGRSSAQSAQQRVQRAEEGQRLRQNGRNGSRSVETMCRGLERVARTVSDTQANRFSSAIASVSFQAADEFQGSFECPEIYNRNENLLPFVLEHVVALGGTIRRPGVYPITEATPLSALIGVAGGLMATTDRTSIEYMEYTSRPDEGTSRLERHTVNLVTTDAATLNITPGSGLRFNQIVSQQEAGGVLLTGEFKRPGFYTIRRGERLSELVERAGGVTEQAYPYGAVFTRESARESQQQGFQRVARQIETALAAAAQSEEANQQSLAAAQATAQRLRNVEVAGRMVIEADPVVLEARPGLDILLQPGDRLHMPKRPSSVTVSGDVLNPGTLQFVPGKSVEEYIDEAGGFQESADEGRVFIVRPNGAAEPVSLSSWNFSGTPSLPPGTTIVVPKDLTPFNWQRFAVDMTSILSQLAVSAAALNTITN